MDGTFVPLLPDVLADALSSDAVDCLQLKTVGCNHRCVKQLIRTVIYNRFRLTIYYK